MQAPPGPPTYYPHHAYPPPTPKRSPFQTTVAIVFGIIFALGASCVACNLLAVGTCATAMHGSDERRQRAEARQVADVEKEAELSPSPEAPEPTAPSSDREGTPSEAATEPQSPWTYESTDQAMGGTSRTASVVSRNTFEFDFPYQGEQNAILTLRNHPRHGSDVLLSIERGQFMCGVFDCTIVVRFDEGKPMKFRAVAPSDHSTTTLFVRKHKAFAQALSKANLVRIEAEFFQAGTRVLEFDVRGFDPTKLRP